MAMEIKVNGNAYKTDYDNRLQAQREKAEKAGTEQGEERAEKAGTAQGKEQEAGQKPVPHDEYISSEKSGETPNGLYYLGQDENGSRKVYFNDPKKAEKEDGNAHPERMPDDSDKDKDKKAPGVNGNDSDNGEEKCVGNTDQVDREIRELKEKKKKLEQQIKKASGDEENTKELESKLAQVERELSQKDNDTYRRQHSTFRNL